ncbi:carbon monoxide dehydrogenase [Terrabacter sp. 28]|nr:carbon monoxide dehydrogenase [Terrabacter sp. 28]
MTITEDRASETPAAEIGKARTRKEDQRLITGRTRWTDNIQLPGMLHLAMVRSPFAHATISAISVDEAKGAPGVIAVFTGEDLKDIQGVNITAWPISADQKTPDHLPVAVSHVAHAGEIVAVVAARSSAEARDAAELVDVDYDELPAVLDLKEAAKDEVLAHPDLGTNKSAFWQLDSAGQGSGGDVDEAIAKARDGGIVIEREYRQQRLIPAFMEPRSTVVDPTGEQVTMWSATQVPHVLRFCIAATTGLPESKIRVIAPDVGGGFGGKLQTTPEEFATLAVARKLGKPCKFTETRSETMVSGHHGRDQWQKLTLAAEKDGTVTGLKVELMADLGAYAAIVGGGVPVLGAWMFNSIYKFGAYQFNTTNYYTNKTWVDAYRGAGRPEATYAIERLMDELAVEVGVDPLEIREKNWIKHDEFPFTTVAGMTYDSGNYEAATAKAKELFGYDELRAEQKQRRESNDPVQLGLGVSTFTEMCGLAPSRILGALSYGAGGWESASIRMLATGTVEVVTGTSPHGQGHETAWSQIVADRLGVPFENVEVLHGDTQIAPKGMDSYGSRSLVVGGEAVLRAADKVIEKAKPIAAHLLEASVDDVEFKAGTFGVKGTDKGVTISEVALATWTGHNLPDGIEPTIDADATFDPDNFSFPHGTHLCAMEVDTETGATKMRKYVCVDDIGTIINPLIVEGQVHGGLVQGIAQALWEGAEYDDQGTLVTGSFVDYTLPTSADTISFITDHTTSPSTYNTLGTKGVGEAGTIASTPAVVNAIVDAVRHLGVNDIVMPCTPERVWKAIQAGSPVNTEGERDAAPHFDEGAPNQDPASGASEGSGQ